MGEEKIVSGTEGGMHNRIIHCKLDAFQECSVGLLFDSRCNP